MDRINISVVIPTYNRRDQLAKTLESLFDQDYPKDAYEIIVIDDGSIDGTEKLIKTLEGETPCKLRYIKQKNKGPASARNLGVESSKYDTLLLVDSDIILNRDTLTRSITVFQKQKLDIYAPCPVHSNDNLVSRIKNEEILEDYRNPQRIPISACIFMKKKHFNKIGGFPEFFYFAGGEDLLFFEKAKKLGLTIKCDANNTVLHNDNLNIKNLAKTGIRYGRALYLFRVHNRVPLVKFYIRYCISSLQDVFRNAKGVAPLSIAFIEKIFTHYGFFKEMIAGQKINR